MLVHFSLFTGIGGIDMAAEWAGFKTIGQCEYADYPTKILEKHWPDVRRWRDIRDVTAKSVKEAGIQTITLISGGFPCQPFSIAGKRKGKKDDRDLWPEMFRVIRELKPRWVLGENVANFVNMELERTLLDLEGEEYETQTIVIPACAVGAPHRRDRAFIVAYAHSGRSLQGQPEKQSTEGRIDAFTRSSISSENVADTEGIGQYRNRSNREQIPVTRRAERKFERVCVERNICNSSSQRLQDGTDRKMGKPGTFEESQRPDWWTVEPNVGRVAYGISNRMDRLKCLGNAVVPQQVYPILQAIADIENAI